MGQARQEAGVQDGAIVGMGVSLDGRYVTILREWLLRGALGRPRTVAATGDCPGARSDGRRVLTVQGVLRAGLFPRGRRWVGMGVVCFSVCIGVHGRQVFTVHGVLRTSPILPALRSSRLDAVQGSEQGSGTAGA